MNGPQRECPGRTALLIVYDQVEWPDQIVIIDDKLVVIEVAAGDTSHLDTSLVSIIGSVIFVKDTHRVEAGRRFGKALICDCKFLSIPGQHPSEQHRLVLSSFCASLLHVAIGPAVG